MSKTKALLCGVISVAGLVGFVLVKDMTGIVAFAASAVLFLGIWFAKYYRDWRLVYYARKQRTRAQDAKAAPVTSGSNSRSSVFFSDRQQNDLQSRL